MKLPIAHCSLRVLAAFLGAGGCLFAQTPPDPPPADEGRPVSIRKLPRNILSDQKQIWTSPPRLVRNRHWIPTLAAISFTAGLVATDTRTGSYFRRTGTFSGYSSIFTSTATGAGIAIVPVGLFVAGSLTHDRYARHTALLTGEALASTEILGIIMKDIGRRRRPQDFAPGQSMAGSWFSQTNGLLAGVGSFPSEHSAAAFAVATVVSRRYVRHKWIPYVAYGLSSAVGFSRLTTSAHFPSDVFMGAVLGYGIGRFVVLRQ